MCVDFGATNVTGQVLMCEISDLQKNDLFRELCFMRAASSLDVLD